MGQSNSPSENYLFLNVMINFVIVNQKMTGSALHIEKNQTIHNCIYVVGHLVFRFNHNAVGFLMFFNALFLFSCYFLSSFLYFSPTIRPEVFPTTCCFSSSVIGGPMRISMVARTSLVKSFNHIFLNPNG